MSIPADYEPTQNEARAHSMVVGAVAHLIDLTGEYLNSPDGSEQEEATNAVLVQAIEAYGEGNLFASDMLMCMASMIVATVPQDAAQKWFDTQAEKIAETLGVEL